MKSANATPAEFAAAGEATGPAPVSLWQVLRGPRADPLERWTRIRAEHGDVARYRFTGRDSYLVSSAEGVKRILQDNPANYTKEHPSYDMLRRLFGNGLLTSEGSFWLRQRRLAQPAFHRQRLQAMGERMSTAARDTAERWDALARQGEPILVLREMSRYTLRVVGEALFGAVLAEKATVVGTAWDVLNAQLAERFRTRRLLPPILPTRYDRDFRRTRRTLFQVVDEVIAFKRVQGGAADLLTLFMEARDEDTGERMTDGQLRDEVVTMLLAGHETTAIALAWVWIHLAQHSHAARALHAELDNVLAGRTPGVTDLPQLPYTRAVIDETLRLVPPAYIVNRQVREDDVVCGHRVHRGGSVVISPLVLHRHPTYWEEPEAFRPERWLDEAAEEKRPRFAYLPFSAGPRQCIGNHFALMEAQLLLATLAQRFEPELIEGYTPQPEYLVLCRPTAGGPMRLRPRSPSARVGAAPEVIRPSG